MNNEESKKALQQLRALVAASEDAILRLAKSCRHQYLVEPNEAIKCVSSSETKQIVTGIVGLLGELRHAKNHQLREGALMELLPCLYAATVELCESRTERDKALQQLGFYERFDLLQHVAVSAKEQETRSAAVSLLASLRVTDIYPYAQEALKTVGLSCPYTDTRREALAEYERGLKNYGSGVSFGW